MTGREPRRHWSALALGVLGAERSVKSRVSYGGTAPANVRRQANRWLRTLAKERG